MPPLPVSSYVSLTMVRRTGAIPVWAAPDEGTLTGALCT
jgi:hypothetical protein